MKPTSIFAVTVAYGAPFVTPILLLTEANFVKTEVLLSNKSYFCLTKVIFSKTKVLLSDKSYF